MVAVVVPVYAVQEYVAAALESVRAQTYPRWECVVVDDGSPDDSAARAMAVVAGEPRMRLVRQANQGICGARNRGLAELSASVRFVCFLDSDDELCPTALAELVAALEADPRAVGAYGYAELIDEQGRVVGAGLHPARQRDRRRLAGRRLEPVGPAEPLTFAEAVVAGPIWPPAVALHRREVVEGVGSFDPDLVQMEDWDLYLRMLRSGPFLALDRQVATYRFHPGQVTRRRSDVWYWKDVVRERTWRSPLNTPEQRRTAARAWRQLHLRRTARVGQGLLRAVVRGDRPEAGRLGRGLLVLTRQALAAGPPAVTRREVELTHLDDDAAFLAATGAAAPGPVPAG